MTAAMPEPGTRWRHRNGILYDVVCLTNLPDEERYPCTVVYRNPVNGALWSRRLDDWHRSFIPSFEAELESEHPPRDSRLRPGPEAPVVDRIRGDLAGHANALYARFGHPVWLVGSVLTSPEPRDVDIRIMIPTDEFEARFGPWQLCCADWELGWEQHPKTKRWAMACAKEGRWFSTLLQQNVDFQIQADRLREHHADKPRVRLDTMHTEEPA